jgi:hypothetical protein
MTDIDTLYSEAFAAYKSGAWPRARALLAQSLRRAPNDARALLLLGVTQDKADAPVALALLEAAAARAPENGEIWYNLGVVEAERGALPAALGAYRRCIDVLPGHTDALGNGAELLRRLEYFDEALAWSQRRLALAGADWRAHLNSAISLYHLQRFPEAEAAYNATLALAPHEPIAHWERFSLLLFARRFAEAWDAFEYRFACGHLNGVFAYPFTEPLWRGQDLRGRHVLIHNEQGLGDQVMFAHALGEVVAQAGETTIVVAPTLVDLFAASFPTARVLPARFGAFAGDHPRPDWLDGLAPVDYQAPIGSLMAVLRRDEKSFSPARAFLRASDEARQRWAAYAPGPGLKVGLCWASNPALFRMDSARRAVKKSMELERMAPLADVAGVTLVSVLNWPLPEPRTDFSRAIHDVHGRLLSMDDTAALIEKLDLVITVDTSVAHVAGALGKETWLLLHDFPDCRWELRAPTSYWYPRMRLFRQNRPGDWDQVVADVARALAEKVRG